MTYFQIKEFGHGVLVQEVSNSCSVKYNVPIRIKPPLFFPFAIISLFSPIFHHPPYANHLMQDVFASFLQKGICRFLQFVF